MENINPIGELMQSTMDNVRSMLKMDTVVGDPIVTPDGITLIPISRISVGFGGGGVEFTASKVGQDRPYGGGNATGVKIEPIGFLVIKEGGVRMIPVAAPANTTVDRIVEMVPDTLDKIAAFIDSHIQKNEE